jgi:hypothetical protein
MGGLAAPSTSASRIEETNHLIIGFRLAVRPRLTLRLMACVYDAATERFDQLELWLDASLGVHGQSTENRPRRGWRART